MTLMAENPFVPLTFIAGPAILTNVCAILQNGATIRYGLAIPQWREFQLSRGGDEEFLRQLYADPEAALGYAQHRIRFLLRGLDLLYAALLAFGVTSLFGLAGAVIAARGKAYVSVWLVLVCGAAGLLLLLGALAFFAAEGRCTRALLKLQLERWTRCPSEESSRGGAVNA